MNRLLSAFAIVMLLIGPWGAATALGQTSSEVEALRQEIQKLQDRLNRLEQSQRAPAPGVPPAATTAQLAPRPGEREIQLDRQHPLEIIGLPKPEIG